jgi:hypothetical protein
MAHIILREHEDRSIEVHLHGKAEELASVLASAMINDPHFGILVLSAMAIITEEKVKFPDINLN